MKKGTKVSWQIAGVLRRGNGITISDEDSGTIQVAVHDYGILLQTVQELPLFALSDQQLMEGPVGFHPVIHCTVTWLTVEQ
jgi:hypothetical protein